MALPELRTLLGDAAATADALLAEIRADRARLPVVFPGLPRRLGREPVRGGRRTLGGALVDLDAFRRCDVAAAWLRGSLAATDDEVTGLYAHGDIDERAMALRSLHFLPVGSATVRLFGEVQRTNVVLHLEAAVCDGDLFVRTLGQPGFDQTAANRLLLKLAFLDLPLARVFGAETTANAELSRMLRDLATEREAAGRSVWRDTNRLLGRAPCPGAIARPRRRRRAPRRRRRPAGARSQGPRAVRRRAARPRTARRRRGAAAAPRRRLIRRAPVSADSEHLSPRPPRRC